MSNNSNTKKKTRKITVNIAIDELDISHIQKKVLSEILRLTNLGKGLFKTMENFASELSCEVSYLHNTLYFLNKQGWIERRKGKQDRRLFVYFATQKTLDFVNNFVNDLSTKNEQKINDLSTSCERLVKNISSPSSVQAPNKVFNILNIECIKDLSNEGINNKENKKTGNLTRQQNILNENLEALEKFKNEMFQNLNQKDWIINKKSESQIWNEEKAKANLELVFDKIKVWMIENPKKLNENPKVKTRFNQFAQNNEIGWIYPIKLTYQSTNQTYNQQTNPTKPKPGDDMSYYKKIDENAKKLGEDVLGDYYRNLQNTLQKN